MQQPGDTDVNRCPRRVEEGDGAGAGQELADLRQVAHGLRGLVTGLLQFRTESGAEHPLVEGVVELHAGANQQAASQPFGKAHYRDKQH